MVCLIYTPSALGPVALGLQVYISGNPLLPMLQLYIYIPYSRKVWQGKLDKFGKLFVIRQTKLVLTIDNLMADLLICQTFFCQMLKTSQFAKLSPRKTSPLYSVYIYIYIYIYIHTYTYIYVYTYKYIAIYSCHIKL